MDDDRIERLKRKLAADRARSDEEARRAEELAKKAAEEEEAAKATVGQFKALLSEVIDELRELFSESGHRLHYLYDDHDGQDLIYAFALGLSPGHAAGRLDVVRGRVGRSGWVLIRFGTKYHSPGGQLETHLQVIEKSDLRDFLLDYIDKNVPE